MPKFDVKVSYQEWNGGTRHTETQRHTGVNSHQAVEAAKEKLEEEYGPSGVDDIVIISVKKVARKVKTTPRGSPLKSKKKIKPRGKGKRS